MDIKGNDFKKTTKSYYLNKMKEINCLQALSKFESDEEEEEELLKTFSDLKIWYSVSLKTQKLNSDLLYFIIKSKFDLNVCLFNIRIEMVII